MSAIQALQLWCKQRCDGYRDVHITNMTTSFRDGLAFCAILHRHRPDLIDFNSLSKENIYENNQLAFQVAERELGIPALLDAEDMVSLKVPDRLSILTYVSQYYNYFHGRSPIGGMGGIKRSPSHPIEEPAGKKGASEAVTPALAKSPPKHQKPQPQVDPTPQGRCFPKENAPVLARPVLTENNNTRSSGCAICGGHVHLVQRLLVDGKLYHRNCFRCRKCFNTLQSGNYKAGTEPGTLVCNKHDPPKHLPNSSPVNVRGVVGENEPVGSSPTPGSYLKALEPKRQVQEPLRTNLLIKGSDTFKSEVWSPPNNKSSIVPATTVSRRPDSVEHKPDCRESTTSSWTASSAKTQEAREKFFQPEIRTSSPAADKAEPVKNRVFPVSPPQATGQASPPGLTTSGTNSGNTEKDKARSFLMHALPGGSPSSSRPPGNIIGDTEPRSSTSGTTPSAVNKPGKPPTSKELDNKVDLGTVTQKAPPFSSQPADSGCKIEIKATKVGGGNTAEEKLESPADWRSRLKPVANKPSNQGSARTSQKPVDIHRVEINITPSAARKEIKPTSPAASPLIQNTAAIKGKAFVADQSQKKKLLVPNLDLSNDWQKPRQQWEEVPAAPKTEERGFPRKTVAPIKPSPPRPFQIPSRNQVKSPNKSRPDYVPEEEIQKELRQIEDNLDELEHKGVDLEKQLRACEGDEKEDALMVEWFKLIHEKQLLLRRESELMHKRNQQKLEEQQWGIEGELRNLMNKPESLKSPKEKAQEAELLQSYLAAVEGRNKIVENLDEDRLREREEDEMLAAMIQKFDLPRSNQENEKKKTKFGLFRILKQKNKVQE